LRPRKVRPIEARTPADGEREGRVSDPGGASWESAGGVVVVLEEEAGNGDEGVAGQGWLRLDDVPAGMDRGCAKEAGAVGPWVGFKGGGFNFFGPNGG